MSDMNDVQNLRDLSELLQQISAVTGLSQEAIEAEVEGLEYTTFKFNNSILVSPSDFESIIDSWAEQLKTQLISGNGSVTVASSPKTVARAASKTAKSSPNTITATKTKPKVTSAKAKISVASAPKAKTVISAGTPGSLPLPEDYRSIVSHLYGPSLKRIMPQDPTEQKSFLEAIANETPAGVELLEHLSVIIADKYTGKMAPTAAYNGLKNKALALLNGEVLSTPKGRGRRVVKKEAAPKGKKATTKKPAKVNAKTTATTAATAQTAATKTIATAQAAAAKIKVAKTTAKPKARVALAGMELPKGYRKRVSNRYGPTLKSLLPEDPTLRAAYLKEIIAESEIGKAFLERVADSIKIKYRGRISRHTAYSGLLDKAKSM